MKGIKKKYVRLVIEVERVTLRYEVHGDIKRKPCSEPELLTLIMQAAMLTQR